ncbi:uncharacterized protein LOC113213503 [Frankliniella occidentalis]|uniref:Uncharacterized protein LOC113213503 n=1 Tax=Frankliniella occidentalis TaxID=133901 RepID=A0A9C6U6B1_FRAOC|nr:uncharacterized protein LOC113213503 [Frankliniella occidentalis]XP_052122473.1 uncharacterized protein LOC113213503 [Frankliniella occidentalis]XP_052122506.1 uncharacterized protein LOC113213503 [Frankliniella occidentalis]XP_052122543.1 uncharacterized protein LOC113213503 [Frankliniella occidentalis]XP_052122575.1 uncharacterized protein LOC113213503 [Frankliniella occidentalis]
MSLTIVALLALLCRMSTHGRTLNSFAGPYIAFAERFYNCETNLSLPWQWAFHPSRFNPYKPRELQLLTGNLTARNVDMDDSWWLKVILDVWANNQWKENAFVLFFKNRACSSLRANTPSFYEHVFKREIKDRCIIKRGVYEVRNAPIEWVFPNIPIMPYGRYKHRSTSGKADKYLCLSGEFHAIPKVD